jgi:hypothetical protein
MKIRSVDKAERFQTAFTPSLQQIASAESCLPGTF